MSDSRKLSAEKPCCPTCSKPYEGNYEWCDSCDPKRLVDKLEEWTSETEEIDEFIQKTQRAATRWSSYTKYFEWAEPTEFTDVKYLAKGGFGSVYTATWTRGYRIYANDGTGFRRKSRSEPLVIVLKTLNDKAC